MKINRKKNGYRITVKDWSNVVTVTNLDTGKVINTATFSDHIKAVLAAKAL